MLHKNKRKHDHIWKKWLFIFYKRRFKGLKSHQLSLVLAGSFGVAVRVEEHLRVTVDGHKGFDVAMRLNKVHDGLDLRLRVSTRSTVRLWARGTARTRTWRKKIDRKIPLLLESYDTVIYSMCFLLLPPNPASQFLLGSTPTQLDPGLGFLVLRHIRFCTYSHKHLLYI